VTGVREQQKKQNLKRKNIFSLNMSTTVEEEVRNLLDEKGLGSFASKLVGPSVGVESMEDLGEVDDEMMISIGMSPIQRKKFKSLIEKRKNTFGAPKRSIPMPPPPRSKSQEVKLFSSPDMKSEEEIVVTDSNVTEDASVPSDEEPVVVVKEENNGEDEDSEDETDSEDDLELDFNEDGETTKIPPPPKRDGEVRTSWMAAMDVFSRSDGAKKTITTYTIRLADGSSYNHIVTVDFDGTRSEKDESAYSLSLSFSSQRNTTQQKQQQVARLA